MVYFGIEIECIGFAPETLIRELRAKGFAVRFGAAKIGVWGIGYDLSIGERSNSAEVRSPKFEYDDRNIEQVIEVARELKRLGCRISHRCGIHVHVSSMEREISLLEMGFIDLPNWVVNQPNNHRCKNYCSTSMDSLTGKYDAIRFIDSNRLEFRFWNGSLNVRHLCRSIRESVNLFNVVTNPVSLSVAG